MDATLHALAGILLRAIPTFLIVVLLHFYIKRMFFRPLEKVLNERRQATEGTRRIAEATFAKASQKAVEYDAALRVTKAQIYREMEEQRLKLREEHAAAVQQARKRSEEIVAAGKREIEAEASTARQSLDSASELLATRIADLMFQERVN